MDNASQPTSADLPGESREVILKLKAAVWFYFLVELAA